MKANKWASIASVLDEKQLLRIGLRKDADLNFALKRLCDEVNNLEWTIGDVRERAEAEVARLRALAGQMREAMRMAYAHPSSLLFINSSTYEAFRSAIVAADKELGERVAQDGQA